MYQSQLPPNSVDGSQQTVLTPAYQQQIGVVNQHQQPMAVYQHQQQNGSVVPMPVIVQPQVQGRFAPHVGPKSTKVCGDLLITLGVFMLIGQALETTGISLFFGSVDSYIDYAGYWGGVIVRYFYCFCG
jgi:hypothetical protein